MSAKDDIYTTPAGSPVTPDKFDVRVRLRYLTRGALTLDELNKHLSSLPDDTSHADFRNYDALIKDESPEGVPPGGISGATTH